MTTIALDAPRPTIHPLEARSQRTLHIFLLAMALWTWGFLVPYAIWHAHH